MHKKIMLPEGFIQQMKELLPEKEVLSFLQSYEKEPVKGLRLENDKLPLEKVAQALYRQQEEFKPIPWQKDAYLIHENFQAGKSPLHEMGVYYLQEPSAMIPISVLNPLQGERVLDLCGAPGGKSTQISKKIGDSGCLVANEPVLDRVKVLGRNIERMSCINTVVTNEYPQRLAETFPMFFDKILVDAPCSGEGMFRKNPEAMLEWSEEQVLLCSRRQREILKEAYKMLKAGGLLCYSTCTFNRKENEEVIEWFLQEYPNCSLEPFTLALDQETKECEGTFRAFPHQLQGEGHFVALIKKREENKNKLQSFQSLEGRVDRKRKRKAKEKEKERGLTTKEAGKLYEDFFGLENQIKPNNLFKNQLVHLPDGLIGKLKGVKVLRMGLVLGEVRQGRFIPNHSFAVSQRVPKGFLRFELTLNQLIRYLLGEVLPCPEEISGWVLLTYKHIDVGWGKASQGMIKNHYPKGLRKSKGFFET